MSRISLFQEGNILTIAAKQDCSPLMKLLLRLTDGKVHSATQVAAVCQLYGFFRSKKQNEKDQNMVENAMNMDRL